MSKKEEEYRRWCIDRHLFLSPLNDLYIDDLAFAEDDIYISGILDKIAYFLNSYFDLGIKEKDITFSSVWKSEKSGRNGYSYKNVLNIENNFPHASLYWISQDFDEKLGEDSNPELKRLREIRNFLEHKYTIVARNYNADDPFQSHPSALYLDESELNERTL